MPLHRNPFVLLAFAVLATAGVAAQVASSSASPSEPSTARSFHVQSAVSLIVGGGGNVTAQIGDDGVLVVDTGSSEGAPGALAELRRIANGKPIRWIVNTHFHPDHTGGNDLFRRSGDAVIAGNVAQDIRDTAAPIIAHEQTLNRMSSLPAGAKPLPAGAIPTDTFFGDRDELFFNDEAVEFIHVAAAHTDGDIMAFFRKSDVISTGDVFVTTTYPVIDVASGGTIDGVIAALNRIIAITVPRDKQERGTMVIPGHGRICDEADVVEYRDMVTIIRDRVRELIGKKMTLEQVRAARPTSDYDGRFGATSGPWTTDQFVEAVYRTLSAAAKGKP